ncbi:MAG: hypothetical protein QOD56_925 [Gammaproteobacteria bacterium]|jgi:hypothetical protein|nr:hypothetical protein [Gammaproteobacteria bacterium]
MDAAVRQEHRKAAARSEQRYQQRPKRGISHRIAKGPLAARHERRPGAALHGKGAVPWLGAITRQTAKVDFWLLSLYPLKGADRRHPGSACGRSVRDAAFFEDSGNTRP